MVMQDGGTVDVRPGHDPRRAAPEHSGAYLATGLCLALYALAMLGWTVYGIAESDGSTWDFVEGLFNPGASPAAQLLGPYEWAFTVVFLVVAGLALAQRRVVRTAALLSGFLLLAVSAREGVGLLDAAYRDQYSNDPLGGWALATRGLGLLTALVVLTVMFPATERRGGATALGGRDAAPGSGEPDAGWRRPTRISGVLFLLNGLAQLAWTVRNVTSPGMDAGRYLRDAVDASVLGNLHVAATVEFTTVGSVVVLLVLGVLAVRGRRDVRGALVVFAAVQLYLTVRTVVWLAVTDFFNRTFETTEGALSMVTTAFALAAMTSVVLLATGRGFGPYGGARAETFRTALDGRYSER
ncbi:hypothetical protein FCH28_17455 [Streptomyces piniterrae]|uniref:Uncharacterized protein n=1 Tax=Streptomyces piniterrae TaxID=2571125 RepID=A0A4U0NG86_9ACTN|nr:hypothetical protein [Streptomyces piniterrae]TJZ52953.1 hypothetical protein FCH28_17455 [Streptomyces piniterrae]